MLCQFSRIFTYLGFHLDGKIDIIIIPLSIHAFEATEIQYYFKYIIPLHHHTWTLSLIDFCKKCALPGTFFQHQQGRSYFLRHLRIFISSMPSVSGDVLDFFFFKYWKWLFLPPFFSPSLPPTLAPFLLFFSFLFLTLNTLLLVKNYVPSAD